MTEKSILIVDDNPVNLKLIRLVLAGEGYDVHTAEDAEGALRIVRNSRPRMILMDIQLPGVNGARIDAPTQSGSLDPRYPYRRFDRLCDERG